MTQPKALITTPIMGSQQKEENFLLRDDLKTLSGPEKAQFYKDLAKHLGLDPITKPFGLYDFQGKEVLYIKANAFDQLCARHKVSRKIMQQEVVINDKVVKQDFVSMGDSDNYSELVYLVKVEASIKVDGEIVVAEDVAVVPQYEYVKGSSYSDKRAWKRNNNALMKAITKAYRRAAQKLISIGTVLLEDELDPSGEAREITETGDSAGGKTMDMLDYKLPQSVNGFTNLKDMCLKEGAEALIKLDQKLKKQQPLPEEWKAVSFVINKYIDSQAAMA